MTHTHTKSKKPFVSIKDTTIPYVEFVKRFSTEFKARQYLARLRWPNGVVCPRCGLVHVYAVKRDGIGGYYECRNCRKVFTVRTGTVFERSHVPLTKWLFACYKVITSRKGISSVQLAVDIGVTQKTAWFMLQRIRMSCTQTVDANQMLKNIVEADASYFGGKEKCKHASKKLRLGRGTVGKVAVLGAKERGGKVAAKVILDTGSATVHKTLSEMVSKDATLMTDEHSSYNGVPFADHKVVRHAVAEFVKGMASTNEIESVWSVLKRGWIGIYHHFSAKHLQLYVNEFCFRLNEGKCETKLDERIKSLCMFSLKRKHYPFKELLAREGDNGLMRAA
jgi:transposase-like protein